MIDEVEMEQRLLSELEEAMESDVFSLLNTVLDPIGVGNEVMLMCAGLRSMVQRDLALMGFEGFSPRDPEELTKERSLALLEDLPNWFRFDLSEAMWKSSKGDLRATRYPMVFVTEAGKDEGFRILDERGYQWWRKDR